MKTPIKPQSGWIIVSGGVMIFTSLWIGRTECLKRFVKTYHPTHKWSDLKRSGYDCIKVNLNECVPLSAK
jgi:hypothetical protein